MRVASVALRYVSNLSSEDLGLALLPLPFALGCPFGSRRATEPNSEAQREWRAHGLASLVASLPRLRFARSLRPESGEQRRASREL